MDNVRSVGRDGSRGQSEVLGYVLLLGLVLAGATVVVVFGAVAVNDTEDAIRSQQLEQSMTQFDAEASQVVLGQSESRTVSIGNADVNGTVVEDGRMIVDWVDRGGGDVELANESLGAVVYEVGGTQVAYQGGGVWRKDGNTSRMVSSPEFHYRDATLTLPIVSVDGENRLDGSAIIQRDGPTRRVDTYENPVSDGMVVVTVRSEYYEAWGEFFETRTEGSVEYDHANETVSMNLVIPVENPRVEAGVISGAPGTTLVVSNHAYVDSYNSSEGPYSSSAGSDTKLIAAGDVVVKQHGQVDGSVQSGGDVELQNHAGVDGDVEADGSVVLEHHAEVTGIVRHGDGLTNDGTIGGEKDIDGVPVQQPESAKGLIDEERSAHEGGDNDNDNATDVTGNSLTACDCELRSGTYYLEDTHLTGTLTLNTSDGPIDVVIDGDLHLGNGGHVEVTGPHRVNVYLEGNFTMDNAGSPASHVSVDGDRSPLFWLYMNPDAEVTMQTHTSFTGVIYGPADSGPGVAIDIHNHVEVFGALVGDVPEITQHHEVHYDEALANETAIDRETTAPQLTYLHITINEIEVTDD